jgi:hypothetical protein
MSLVGKISLVSLLFLAVSCYNPKTHGQLVTEHKDAWINGHGANTEEHQDADKGLIFCRANVKENGEAEPVCFKPEFKEKEED